MNQESYESRFIVQRDQDMPKGTFFNLPADKRDRVMEVALEEFASKDYQDVYVTTIADRAGIAKGSLYQYFEDKRDLFLHLIETVQHAKMEFIRINASQELEDFREGDFFQTVAAMIVAGLKFGHANPLYERLYHRISTIPQSEPAAQSINELIESSARTIVSSAVASGSLRDDVPQDLMVSVFLGITRSFASYMLPGREPRALQTHGGDDAESAIRSNVDHLVSLLREGFAHQKRRSCP